MLSKQAGYQLSYIPTPLTPLMMSCRFLRQSPQRILRESSHCSAFNSSNRYSHCPLVPFPPFSLGTAWQQLQRSLKKNSPFFMCPDPTTGLRVMQTAQDFSSDFFPCLLTFFFLFLHHLKFPNNSSWTSKIPPCFLLLSPLCL